MTITANKDKFKGVVFGSLVGDALGGPLEFMSAKEIIGQHDGPVTDMIGGGVHQLEKGEITDDSQLSMIALESIVKTGCLDADDIAGDFISWINGGPKDAGILTRKVLKRAQETENGKIVGWKKASKQHAEGFPDSSRGNGSLMRCYPAALLSYRHSLSLIFDTARLSQLTHYDSVCVAACIMFNQLLANLITSSLETKLFADNSPDFSIIPTSTAIPETAYIKNYLEENNPERPVPGGYVLDTLHIGIWGLFQPGFEEGLVKVVNRGGDADTNAAVAGALLGARFGYSAIPKRWLDCLDPQIKSRAEFLAEQLYNMPEKRNRGYFGKIEALFD